MPNISQDLLEEIIANAMEENPNLPFMDTVKLIAKDVYNTIDAIDGSYAECYKGGKSQEVKDLEEKLKNTEKYHKKEKEELEWEIKENYSTIRYLEAIIRELRGD